MERKSLIRKLSDYAGINSLIFGGLTAFYFYEIKGHSDETPFWFYPSGIAVGTALFYDFLTTSRRLSEPVIKNFIKLNSNPRLSLAFKPFKKERNKEEIDSLIKAIDEDKQIYRYKSTYELSKGAFYIERGNLEEGVEYFKKFFEYATVNDFITSIHEKVLFKIYETICNNNIKNNPGNIRNYFSLVELSLRRGDFGKSTDYWRKVCNLDIKEKIDLNILFALFLDSIEKTEKDFEYSKPIIKSSEQWTNSINLILNKSDLESKFKKIAESRNEVLEYGSNDFLKSTFVFKRAKNKEELRKGYLINSILYEFKDLNLARPLGLFEDIKELTYDVSQRKPLNNLEECFSNNSDINKEKMLSLALQNQRKIHAMSRNKIRSNGKITINSNNKEVELKKYDYKANLKRRLIDRLGFNYEAGQLLNKLEDINEREEFYSLIHGDLALPNILEDGTIIDFEKAAFGNPVIDVVTSLEDPKNGNVNRKKLFESKYLDGSNESDFLISSYDDNAAFISVCQVGSKLHQGDFNRAEKFAKQVLEKKCGFKDKFVKYMKSTEKGTVLLKEN